MYFSRGQQVLVEGKFSLREICRAAKVTKPTAVAWRRTGAAPEGIERRRALQDAFGIEPGWWLVKPEAHYEAPMASIGHQVIVDACDAAEQAQFMITFVDRGKLNAYIPLDAPEDVYPVVINAADAQDQAALIELICSFGNSARAA